MTYELGQSPVEAASFGDVLLFTEGKNPPRNEDLTGFNDTVLVLSDGATDKTGLDFEGRTGGELAAQAVVEAALATEASGEELVAQATHKLRALYQEINPHALHDSAYRFAATLVVARVVDNAVIVTQVGDSSFRINGVDEYKNDKIVDSLTAGTRKHYIEKTGDIKGSRDYIMPLLKVQHQYQNNPDSPLGYGVIDGTPVPSQFINTYSFPIDSVDMVELVSDGYYGVFPDSATLEGYEAVYRRIEQDDPNKCSLYPSTKLSDDRTVLIAHILR